MIFVGWRLTVTLYLDKIPDIPITQDECLFKILLAARKKKPHAQELTVKLQHDQYTKHLKAWKRYVAKMLPCTTTILC